MISTFFNCKENGRFSTWFDLDWNSLWSSVMFFERFFYDRVTNFEFSVMLKWTGEWWNDIIWGLFFSILGFESLEVSRQCFYYWGLFLYLVFSPRDYYRLANYTTGTQNPSWVLERFDYLEKTYCSLKDCSECINTITIIDFPSVFQQWMIFSLTIF